MMNIDFDIDIDMLDRDQFLNLVDYTDAKLPNGRKHNTGVYFQSIPKGMDNKAGIDHKIAEQFGYFKVDLLNNSAYQGIRDISHLRELSNKDPDWSLLEHEEFLSQMFHISSYIDLVKFHKPKSIEQLAMLLAIIRPSKKHLQYKTWDEIEKTVWDKPDSGYYFKKSHSIAYSMVIVVQMNLLVEKILGSI